MKKKIFILSSIIFIIVAAVGAMFLLPNKTEATTAVDENGITWDFTVSGRYIDYLVYYSGAIPADGKVVVPETLEVGGNEYIVRSVGYSSGSNKSMFYNASYTNRTKIKEIVLPDSVQTVRNYAFYALSNLTKVDLGKGVKTLNNYIFASTNVTEVILPNSVTSIGSYTFSNTNGYNYKITKIAIGDGISPAYLSKYYNILSRVPYVTGWDVNEESTKYMAVDGEVYSKDGKTLYAINPKFSGTTYTVNENVTAIGQYAFAEATSIQTVVLNDNIKTIGDYAFYYCSGLRNIDLPDSLISIGNYGFYNCSSLSGTLQLPETLTNIGTYAFYNCRTLTGDLIIPDSVTTIGYDAFYNCTGFNGNLVIGNGLTVIEESVFNNITTFKRITIGSGVKTIKRYAFTNLTDFWINNIEGSVYFEAGYGGTNSNYVPYPHFLNCTHRVTIGTSEGIRVINTETNQEVLSGNYDCETSFRYKVVVDPGYDYSDLKIIEINNNDNENAVTHSYVEGQEYEFSTLLRDRKIYIESIKAGYDLSLRTYITDVNYTTVSKPRIPFVELDHGSFNYVHTKAPLRVENNDDVTFRIRIYNESLFKSSADEVTVYIPEGMMFDSENIVNVKNGWTFENGVAKTTALENIGIPGYYGNGIASYKDLDIVLKVTDTSAEEDIYKTVFAEITRQGTVDADSTPGNVSVSQNYMIDEILSSNSNSAINSQEDDDDFDTVVLNAKFRVEYSIRIDKIDSKTDEVLKGAKFRLASYGSNELEIKDETTGQRTLKTYTDGETIATAISDENGIVDFGGLTSYGAGENEYLVEEIDAPSGYLTNIGKKMKVRVVKTILDREKGTYGVKVFCGSTDYAVDTSTYEFTPIKTAEQLAKIGSGETVNVDGMDYEYNIDTNYKLIDDIDLAGINWTPIRNEIKGVFDGDGHKIKNLTIVSTEKLPYSEVGLISTFTGIVQNLTFEDPNIHFEEYDSHAFSNTGYTGAGCFAGTMRQGGIYNCKTTLSEGGSGSITAPADNLGGLVGHTIPGGLVTIIGCENNISIVGGSGNNSNKNTGGLIGCALGSISVQDSVNNGYVQAQSYNAGGLVGFVNPSDYREMFLTAGYDEDNKRIDLLVENEAAEGQYNLTLEIRDRKTQALIGGATYEIDKVEDMVMTQLLDTGSLKLFDKVIEYTGRDVYFLTEDESIEGYSKLNGIIKVIIERYWDNKTNSYKVRAEATIVSHKEYEEFTEQRETNDTDVKGQEFDRGSVFTDANIVNANWNGRKVQFTNNTNNGTVQSNYYNAGGMIGTSYGIVEMEGCKNKGTILSDAKSGGMIAELRTVNSASGDGNITNTQDTTSNSRFTNCVNDGEIYATGSSTGSVAGLVSEARGYLVIENGINNGKVLSARSKQVGGIAGQIHGGIEIKNSVNNGEIYSYGGGVDTECGGIMGQLRCVSAYQEKTPYANVYARITNCKSNGNITGGCATAGVIGLSNGNEVTVVGCEFKGTAEKPVTISVFSDGACGGMVGLDTCKHTTVKDCKVDYARLEILPIGSTYAGMGGIIGNVDYNTGATYARSGENLTLETITLNNNTVKNSTILNKGKEVGGIMGPTNLGSGSNCVTSINNCLVENTEILHYHSGSSQTYNTAAGIFAMGGYGNGTVEINYCLVNNCSIKKTAPDGVGICPGQSCIGGIAGKGNEIKAITITNCDVKNTLIHDNAYDSTSGSPGGILGMIYSVSKDVKISNCNVVNSTIREYGQNVGGIIGGLCSVGGDVIVEDSKVLESNVSREILGDYGTVYNCVGYVAGYIQSAKNVKFTNIDIIGKDLPKGAEGRSTIQSDGANIGAVVGNVQSCRKVIANNIKVKNIDVINTVGTNGRPDLDASQLGGFAGLLNSDYHELNNVTIDNCDIKGYKCYDVGGIAATVFGSNNSFKDVTVKNTNITTQVTFEDSISSYGHAGGIVGEQINSITYDNCNVENCKISCGRIGAAGIVSCMNGTTKIINSNVKNVEIIDSWENTQGEVMIDGYQQYRPYAGVAGTCNSNLEVDNVTVDGIKCYGKYLHIGGIASYASSAKINNCTVKNADFSTERNIGRKNGAVGGIIADGTNIQEFTNNKVKDSEIKTTTHLLGGLIGYLGNSATISGCEVDNVKLTHRNLGHYIDPNTYDYNSETTRGPSMGGIIGETYAQETTIKNTTIKNSTLKAENPANIPLQAGGILGFSSKTEPYTSYISKVTLDNANVINTTIENDTENSATGGLIGMSWDATIKNSAVKQNSKVIGGGHVAGLVGLGIVNITDSKVLNTTVKSTGDYAAVAGVLAIGNERDTNGNQVASTIKGVEIKDTTITGKDDMNGSNHAGGVSAIYAGTVEDVTMSNVDVRTGALAAGVVAVKESVGEIKNVELDDVNSRSTMTHAGGIAGVSNAKISNVKISNSTIKGQQMAGGIVGTSNADIEYAEVYSSTITSEGLHAGGIAGCIRNAVTNSKVKDSTIVALSATNGSGDYVYSNCIGGLVGAGSGDAPDLTTSSVENNTLTAPAGTLKGKYIGAPTAINDAMVEAETTAQPDATPDNTDNTDNTDGATAPLNSGAPVQSVAPTTSNDQSEPDQAQQGTQPTQGTEGYNDETGDAEGTTNSEPTSGTTDEQTGDQAQTTDEPEETTPSTTTDTTGSTQDTTDSTEGSEGTTEGND